MQTTHHAQKVPHAHVLTLLPPSLSLSSYMNLGHPLGHAGDGMHTKLTNEMRHLRREAGVTVIKSIAPVIEGNPFGTARSSLSSDKKHVGQRPHVSHAEATEPESSKRRVRQMRTTTPVDVTTLLPVTVDLRRALERGNQPLRQERLQRLALSPEERATVISAGSQNMHTLSIH